VSHAQEQATGQGGPASAGASGLSRSLHGLRLRLRRWRALKAVLELMGLTRIGKRIYERSLLRGGIHDALVMDCPLRLSVKTSSQIERIDAFPEVEFVSRIAAVVRENDVVWDVGAHIGMVSMLLAVKKRDLTLKLHGFEPEPRNADEFERNISLNGLGKFITAHRFGLADRDQVIPLYVMSQTGDGRHSIMPESAPGHQAVAIRVRAATDVAGSIAPLPDVVKIDVEGAEMLVLRGMDGLLQRGQIRELFIELHIARLQTTGVSSADVEALFDQRGYQLVWSRPRGGEVHQHYRRSDCHPGRAPDA
jgi:FkbM family methyltransferase